MVTGASYPAGGVALDALVLTQVANDIFFDAADEVIAQDAVGFTDGLYLVAYHNTGNAATAELIAIATYSAPQSIQDGPISLTWHADGLLKWA